MVLNIEWKIDSGCYPFLNTTGGGESVQHIFTPRDTYDKVPKYLHLLTHEKCWIRG